MITPRWKILLAAAAVWMAGCGPSDTVTIQGCGATFPAPLYKRWFLEYYRLHPDVRVNYQAIGSGAGVRQFEEGLVHFGATDEALKEKRIDEIAKKLSDRDGHKVEVVQIPLTGGSVALCYNLPGNPAIQLTRKAYVSILLGQITYWDDPGITSINPGVQFPHLAIAFIRRAESSGTTFVFTNHLNAADKRWSKDQGGPGVGKTVQWPVGIGGKGNAGVAALIEQTPGAFGYIETGYAELSHLPIAAVENRAGKFVKPTLASSQEALAEARFDKVLGATVSDPSGPGAYPIVSLTWVVCRKNYADKTITDQLKAVLGYCLETNVSGQGQAISKELEYVALPVEALVKARQAVASIGTE
ncbi:MAG TPA: phosphate ABC transporter substrate-binding protein PstS [Gemmataceae bacterium]|nr:phosphate ABC transporter substrate-binding protein PstS [Gemmataceae bacterium]